MKLLAILMSALLAFATPTPVATETLSGVVSEYAEGEFMLLETADHGTQRGAQSADQRSHTAAAGHRVLGSQFLRKCPGIQF